MTDFKLLSDDELASQPVFKNLGEALAQPEVAYMLELGSEVTEVDLEQALPLLPRLQSFVLNDNPHVRKLPPSFGTLKHLGYVELRNCALEALPDTMADLEHMTDLVLSDCANFKELPAYVGNWSGMIYLEVDGTQISEIPESIGNLKELEELNMNGNKLHALPEGLGELGKLVTLRTYGNYAMYLSAPVFQRLSALEVYDHGVIQFQDGSWEEVQAALPNCTFTQITKHDPLYEG